MKCHWHCGEQQVSPSNPTKYCACHVERLACSISSHLIHHVQCAEQSVSRSNLTKYCACHEIWRCKISEKMFENRWNVIYNAGTIREWSDHDPRMIREWNRQSANPPRNQAYYTFPGHHEHFVMEITTFCAPAIIQKVTKCCACDETSPNTAPPTKCDAWTSPSAAPARKSDDWTLPSAAPAAKSHTWIHQILRLPRKGWASPSAAPATKSHIWTSPNIPATKSDAWTSPSAAPATKSDTWTSPSAAPATTNESPTLPNTASATQNNSYAWFSLHMIRHLQCVEQQVSRSNLTTYCSACHEKWRCKISEKMFENRWNVIYTMRGQSENVPTMTREWSNHDPRMKPSVRNPPRNQAYFSRSPRAFCNENYNISKSHQVLRLPREVTLQPHQIMPLSRKVTLELHLTLLYSTLLYSSLLYFTLLYPTLLYSTLLYSTLLYSTLLYSTLLFSTLYTLLYSTLLYATLLYFTLLYPTLLYLTLLRDLVRISEISQLSFPW